MSNYVPTQCKMTALFFPPKKNKITEAKVWETQRCPNHMFQQITKCLHCSPIKTRNVYIIYSNTMKCMHCFSRQINHYGLFLTKHKDVCINVPVACKISALFFPPKIPWTSPSKTQRCLYHVFQQNVKCLHWRFTLKKDTAKKILQSNWYLYKAKSHYLWTF